MVQQNKTRDVVLAALLTALSILITFSPFKLPVPAPFSVTIGSHVPTMIALFINPFVAVLAVIGSSIGFMITTGNPVVVARAASHIIFALAGVYLIKNKHMNIFLVILITGVLHAGMEAILVYGLTPLIFPAKASLALGLAWTALIGTFFHHLVDCVIAAPILYALEKAHIITTGISWSKK